MSRQSSIHDFDLFDRALDLDPVQRQALYEELDAEESGKGQELKALIDEYEDTDNGFVEPLMPSLSEVLENAAKDMVDQSQNHDRSRPSEAMEGVGIDLPKDEITQETLLTDEVTQQTLLRAGLDPITASAPIWAPQPFRASTPETVGPYRVIRKIGEGGMGSVFLVRQTNPDRQVALKIVNRNVVTGEFLARFQAEYQVLALMNHPYIALMYEAGTTEQGNPYFTMEYVDGVPINQYCDECKLNVRQRLDLFTKVCEGVFHAHQRAVIHRDLKPSNIMVAERDGKPVVKIIDFGIAKGLDMNNEERPFQTATHMVVGTRDYMSPEQMRSGDGEPDTRSDIYSLGVVLYKILTGCLPFDHSRFTNASLDEMMRVYREQDPPRPSRRLSELMAKDTDATEFQTTAAGQLRGELDWVVMKAMEKDVDRRYETVAAFERDIRAFLNHEPVMARPAGFFYKLLKFTRRNRYLVAAGALVFFTLVSALVSMSWSRHEAVMANRRLQGTNQFLMNMLSQPDPQQVGIEAKVVDILANAEQQLQEGALQDKVFEASIRTTLGTTYYGLGQHQPAYDQVAKAWEIRKELKGPDDPETMRTRYLMAKNLRKMGRLDEAQAMVEALMAQQIGILGDKHRDVLISTYELGTIKYRQIHYEEGSLLYRTAWQGFKKHYGTKDSDAVKCLVGLGNCYLGMKDYQGAEDSLVNALAIQKEILGAEHPQTLSTKKNLAVALENQGELEQALTHYREAMEISTRKMGSLHHSTLSALFNYGQCLYKIGRFQEAETVFRDIINRGNDDMLIVLKSKDVLGTVFAATGRLELAIQNHENFHFDKNTRKEKLFYCRVMQTLAYFYYKAERYEKTASVFTELYKEWIDLKGENSLEAILVKADLGHTYHKLGELAKAGAILDEALSEIRQSKPNFPGTNNIIAYHGYLKTDLGQFEQAEQRLFQALAGSTKAKNHNLVREIEGELNRLYDAWGKPEKKVDYLALLAEPKDKL